MSTVLSKRRIVGKGGFYGEGRWWGDGRGKPEDNCERFREYIWHSKFSDDFEDVVWSTIICECQQILLAKGWQTKKQTEADILLATVGLYSKEDIPKKHPECEQEWADVSQHRALLGQEENLGKALDTLVSCECKMFEKDKLETARIANFMKQK